MSSETLNTTKDHNHVTVLALRQAAKARGSANAARLNQPQLVTHKAVPKRSIHTPFGFAAMVHSIAHIEWNAIRLALDAVWRFEGMPANYYHDWTVVAEEETKHFNLLEALLKDLGYSYGDFLAHDGLWHMCEITKGDIVARMGLVPRTLEARGLDATPLVQAKLKRMKLAGLDSALLARALQLDAILDIILFEEVGHVAIGNYWYRWLCEREGLDAIAHYKKIALEFGAPRLKPPLNIAARLKAGFVVDELQL
jgi:uncharacterized ferritin-like protein (DUF455 family)